jgi:hypothetical protein
MCPATYYLQRMLPYYLAYPEEEFELIDNIRAEVFVPTSDDDESGGIQTEEEEETIDEAVLEGVAGYHYSPQNSPTNFLDEHCSSCSESEGGLETVQEGCECFVCQSMVNNEYAGSMSTSDEEVSMLLEECMSREQVIAPVESDTSGDEDSSNESMMEEDDQGISESESSVDEPFQTEGNRVVVSIIPLSELDSAGPQTGDECDGSVKAGCAQENWWIPEDIFVINDKYQDQIKIEEEEASSECSVSDTCSDQILDPFDPFSSAYNLGFTVREFRAWKKRTKRDWGQLLKNQVEMINTEYFGDVSEGEDEDDDQLWMV